MLGVQVGDRPTRVVHSKQNFGNKFPQTCACIGLVFRVANQILKAHQYNSSKRFNKNYVPIHIGGIYVIGIYKITNLINGKSYIGQSVNIEKRFIQHKSVAFNPNDKNYNYPLYRAIRKYGVENFSFEVLEQCSVDELNNKEIYYISKYNAHSKFGYNQDDGGNHASHFIKLSNDLVDAIIQRLKTSLDSSDDIGADFEVTGRTIRSINSGECCFRESETYPIRQPLYAMNGDRTLKETEYYCKECGKKVSTKDSCCVECAHKAQRKSDRPEPLELARLVKKNGFMATGRMFGVDGNAIKKWCEIYGIPRLKDELVNWYNKQLGIVDPPKKVKVKIAQEKQVKQIDIITKQVLNIFPSEGAAARFLGKKKGNHIGEACKGIHPSAYGYEWEYA